MTDETPERSAESTQNTESSGYRIARLVQLEEGLNREQEESNRLRSEVRELTFKLDILERSYSKQLADERVRCDAAEQRVAEQGVRIVELDSARHDAIELLTEAKAELDRLTAERDTLRRKLGLAPGSEAGGIDDPRADDGTINTLLDDSVWGENEDAESAGRGSAGQQAEAPDDHPVEDMISPDVVFTNDSRDD
jgi:hypothetical protein